VRILIAEPDADVRLLLELSVARLGHEPVAPHDGGQVDAVVLEPACPVAHSQLQRFGDDIPPVICLSIYPRGLVLEPPETVEYLVKPASSAQLGRALAGAAAA
jgi:hypothetical protein